MSLFSRHQRRRAGLTLVSAALMALASAGLITAAALVPAPPAVVPLIVLVCVAGPILSAFELARALAVLREPIAKLRRELDRLPETPHPLGF